MLNVIPCSKELSALSFRLILSLEEKELSLRTLEENNLAQQNEVSQLLSAIHQAQKLHSERRSEIQELNSQVTYAVMTFSRAQIATISLCAPTCFPSRQHTLLLYFAQRLCRLQSSLDLLCLLVLSCSLMVQGSKCLTRNRRLLWSFSVSLFEMLSLGGGSTTAGH